MRLVGWICVASIVAALASGQVRAQSSTTGAIAGTVRDAESGDPLAGVTVVATSPKLQGSQAELTGADGSYKIDGLPPGAYLISFYYSEARVERPGIRVRLSRVTRVDQTVDAGGSGGEVIVIDAKAPSIDVTRTDEGITIDDDYLAHIPVPGRTFGAALGAAAGATIDSQGVGFSGSTSLENSYVIDGVNTTSLAGGTIGTPLINEFIDEIQIITGGYQAEFGRATGAVVNILTKSGANEFHGSVFGTITPYVRDRRDLFPQTTAIASEINLDYLADFGVELGGPIVKDKVWFYVGFAPRLSRSDVARIVQTRRDCQELMDDGTLGECSPEHADGLADEDPNTGLLVVEEIDRDRFKVGAQQYQVVSKINFALAPEHQGAVSLLGTPTTGEGLFTVFGNTKAIRADYTSLNTDFAAKWTSKLDDNKLQLEAVFGWHREKYDQDAIDQALNDIPTIRVSQSTLGRFGRVGGEDPRVVDACRDGTGDDPYPGIENCPVDVYWLDSPGFVVDLLRDRKSGKLVVTRRADLGGHHELKAGADFEDNVIDNVQGYNAGKLYLLNMPAGRTEVYRLASALDSDSAPDVCGFETRDDGGIDLDSPNRCEYLDRAPLRIDTINWSAFAQDSWSVRPNLTLNYGVRYEEQRARYAEHLRGMVFPFTGERLGTNALVLRNLWAPRLGAIYDWTKQGRSKVYGSVGRFYESIPASLAAWAFGGFTRYGAFWDFGQCTETNETWDEDPALTVPHPANCPSRVTRDNPPADDQYFGYTMLVTPGTRAQYMDEAVVGVQYEVVEDLRLGAAFKRRSIGRVLEDMSIDGGDTYVVGNPGADGFDEEQERRLEAEIAALPEGDPDREQLERELEQYRGVRRFDEPRRDYDGLELTAVKRFSRNFYLQSSYTLSRTRGNYPGLLADDTGQALPNLTHHFDIVELLANKDGALPQDRTHDFKLDGYYTWDFDEGGLVTSGVRFRAFSGSAINALGAHYRHGSDTSYLLPRGSMGRTELVTSTDLHLSYGRRLASGYELYVFADVFNLFNQEQTARVDQTYTLDSADPVVGGDYEDLVYLKRRRFDDGLQTSEPVARHLNFRNTTARYTPQSIRFGARLTF